MPVSTEARVKSIRRLTGYVFQMDLECSSVAGTAQPGQFVHLSVLEPKITDPLLRRPMSIGDADPSSGTITLLFRASGRGTNILASRQAGDTISLMGPIGRGFERPAPGRVPLLVAGGMGVAPLHFLSKTFSAEGLVPHILAGFPSSREAVWVDSLIKHGALVQVVTEDGSEGFRGRVTDYLDWCVAEMVGALRGVIEVCACGPVPMLKAVQEWCLKSGVHGQISLESRMACGTGACLGCAQRVVDSESGEHYERVCVDGPVFDVHRVVLT